jgi:hypothetical protein
MSSSHRISRRRVLQGLGVTVGLPLLEAMTPRGLFAKDTSGEQSSDAPQRLVVVYVPGGVNKFEWTPEGEGASWKPGKILEPLARVREHVLVLSGLDSRKGETGDNGHPLGCAPFLSSAPINEKDRGGFCTDTSVDQLAAQQLGKSTRLPSLELGCDADSSDVHYSNISWRSPGVPMGKEYAPRAAFGRLFGDVQADRRQRSVLDVVMAEARDLQKRFGRRDRRKIDEYFESIRSVEQRIEFAERESKDVRPPELNVPESVPERYSEHIRLMNEIIALGLEQDATRVCTFMIGDEPGRGGWDLELGFKDHHHTLAHLDPKTKDGQEKLAKITRIDQFFMEQLVHLLERLKSIPEGDGTLLDNSMVLYGSGLEWGRKHNRENLPLILAGGGRGTIHGGRHIEYSKGTPAANLHLSLLDRCGVHLDRLADSTGRLGQLTI